MAKLNSEIKEVIDNVVASLDKHLGADGMTYTSTDIHGSPFKPITIYVYADAFDRGPRIDHGGPDDDWLTDDQLAEVEEEYYKLNKDALCRYRDAFIQAFNDKCSEIIGERVELINPSQANFEFEYGEKGHVGGHFWFGLESGFMLNNLWVDLYEMGDDQICVYFPEIESYFATLSGAVEAVKKYKKPGLSGLKITKRKDTRYIKSDDGRIDGRIYPDYDDKNENGESRIIGWVEVGNTRYHLRSDIQYDGYSYDEAIVAISNYIIKKSMDGHLFTSDS